MSDSVYISRVWRGHNADNYIPICPAETRWNLVFLKKSRKVSVSIEGARTNTFTKLETAETKFLVIQFKHGVYLPKIPAGELLNVDIHLPDVLSKTFCLGSEYWEIPTYDTVEHFVARLAKTDTLVQDAQVVNALAGELTTGSERTIRRRFLQATGLTPYQIEQIERSRQTASLLERGVPILDIVHQMGYADQPHLIRSLKRFIGQTPTQITQKPQPSYCPKCSRQGLLIDLCYNCSMINQKEFDHA
ncbi:MAG: helix-turn-helix domain-containing protein [Chloroflexota bacterium]